jgi:hypothetical protein
MKLLRAPTRPRWSALMRHPRDGADYTEWRPYLNIVASARHGDGEGFD